jgi:O-antigen ligase
MFFIFVLAFITIGLLLAVFGQTAIERAIFTLGGKDGRFDLYVQTLELMRARPWLGFGFDTFGLTFEQVHRPPVSPDLVWNRAHSTYLALWVEMGLVFGSLPLVIGAGFMIRQTRIVLAAPRDFVLAIAGLGVMVLAALHSLVDFSLEMSANVFLFLTIVALAAGTRLQPGARTAKRSGTR